MAARNEAGGGPHGAQPAEGGAAQAGAPAKMPMPPTTTHAGQTTPAGAAPRAGSRYERRLMAREKWRQRGMTERELEVWQRAGGMSRRMIAQELCISRETVRTHFQNLHDKLGVSTHGELVALAWSSGLVEEAEAEVEEIG